MYSRYWLDVGVSVLFGGCWGPVSERDKLLNQSPNGVEDMVQGKLVLGSCGQVCSEGKQHAYINDGVGMAPDWVLMENLG